MRRLTHVVAIGLTLALPATAGDLDGSKPLQCFVGEVQECQPARDCLRFTADEVGLPELVTVDFASKELRGKTSDGRDVKSALRTILHEDGDISLQGHEHGRSFSLVIDAATGKLTGAAGEPGAAFVVFGRCVAR